MDGIDFSIREGEIFGFLGPNGAGKTSTINMMIGLSRPTGGSIVIGGVDAVKYPKKAQSIMGVVADESNLYDEMDGFGNLCFCASLYGMRKQERERRARALLEQFNLADAGRRPFRAYSKGMRRKLTIAAGIIHSPRILFLDEPTTGIDVESARQIRDLIVDLKRRGTTVFITTHYIEDAQRICDRIAFIVAGKIVAAGTVPALMESVSHGHRMQLTTEAGAEIIETEDRVALLPILQDLAARGIEVYEAKELRPTLEDVFVQVTGIESAKLKKEKGSEGK